MQAVTVSQFSANLERYFKSITQSGDILIVPQPDSENAVVMMSIREYNSLQETAYVSSTVANHTRMIESLQQAQEGKIRPFTL